MCLWRARGIKFTEPPTACSQEDHTTWAVHEWHHQRRDDRPVPLAALCSRSHVEGCRLQRTRAWIPVLIGQRTERCYGLSTALTSVHSCLTPTALQASAEDFNSPRGVQDLNEDKLRQFSLTSRSYGEGVELENDSRTVVDYTMHDWTSTTTQVRLNALSWSILGRISADHM